jgi:hypothetical protein
VVTIRELSRLNATAVACPKTRLPHVTSNVPVEDSTMLTAPLWAPNASRDESWLKASE